MRAFATMASIAVIASGPAYAADPVELSAFVAIPRPAPTATFQYGTAAAQGVDFFLPNGAGPHPVAILIHGGCWSVTTAGREQLRHLGGALAGKGIVVWSIGYRRANEPGGGYPGTFQDVSEAIDRVRLEAVRYNLDLQRLVFVGHSAGGHLALWASARDQLPASSPLYSPNPLLPRSVISLAGIGDLKAFAPMMPSVCGPGIIESLAPQTASTDPYAEISPVALPPSRVKIVMISGVIDRLVPPYVAHDYARALRKSGALLELVDIPGAGHFDLVATGTRAWEEVSARILSAVAVVP